MSKPKRPTALERLTTKIHALGYDWFKPEYVRRLQGKHRNAEWWQRVPLDAPLEDKLNQSFCSYYTVAALAADGVEIYAKRHVGYIWIHIKEVKKQ